MACVTALAVAGVAVAAVGAGTAIYNGVKQTNAQQKALKGQTTATQTAEAAALSTQRKNETATNAANAKTPDISSILSQSANFSKVGIGSTMLTGAGGVDNKSLTLGKSTLLG